jgi:plasmid stabilization system protein ParE
VGKPFRQYSVKIQQEATDELDLIYRFVLQDSPSRARNFLKKLKQAILSLRNFPRRGTRIQLLERDESNLEIRFIEYKGYLIFYTIDQQEVTILHITGPGQDWLHLFSS